MPTSVTTTTTTINRICKQDKQDTHRVVRFVRIVQLLNMLQERLQIGRQMLQQQPMVVLLLHQTDLLLVLDLAPRQLPVDELHQHVEQRPQIIVTSHLPIAMRIDRRIAHRAAEAGGRPRASHLTGAGRVLAGEAEVEHVDASAIVGQASDGEVALLKITGIALNTLFNRPPPPTPLTYRLNIPMQKPHRMYGLDRPQDLRAQPQRRAQREGAARLRPPQFGQILALQLHHDVVEAIVAAAADEPADVLLALQLLQHGHFHFQHLLGLARRLHLEGDLLARDQVLALVDLAEAAAANFAHHLPSLLDDVAGLEQVLGRHSTGAGAWWRMGGGRRSGCSSSSGGGSC